MGRGKRAGKVTKECGPRNIFATVQLNVKRVELQTIANIQGATQETIGGVISYAVNTNQHDDDKAERASEPGNGFDTTSTTTSVTRDSSAF